MTDCPQCRFGLCSNHAPVGVDAYPVGAEVEWEASPYGSRFVGLVTEHEQYCGQDALRVSFGAHGGGRAIVYPHSVLRLIKEPSHD